MCRPACNWMWTPDDKANGLRGVHQRSVTRSWPPFLFPFTGKNLLRRNLYRVFARRDNRRIKEGGGGKSRAKDSEEATGRQNLGLSSGDSLIRVSTAYPWQTFCTPFAYVKIVQPLAVSSASRVPRGGVPSLEKRRKEQRGEYVRG